MKKRFSRTETVRRPFEFVNTAPVSLYDDVAAMSYRNRAVIVSVARKTFVENTPSENGTSRTACRVFVQTTDWTGYIFVGNTRRDDKRHPPHLLQGTLLFRNGSERVEATTRLCKTRLESRSWKKKPRAYMYVPIDNAYTEIMCGSRYCWKREKGRVYKVSITMGEWVRNFRRVRDTQPSRRVYAYDNIHL